MNDRACTYRTMSDNSARWDKGQWWCQSEYINNYRYTLPSSNQVPYRTGGFLARSLRLSCWGETWQLFIGHAHGWLRNCIRDTLVLLRSLVPSRNIFTTVTPQSVSVHHFWFGFWALLNSVNEIINPFGDNVWTLPGALQLRGQAFLSQRVVQPDSITSLKWLTFQQWVISLFHFVWH